ncbi:MAG: 2-hydroxyacid dehydrogenase [Maricaulaceae bacterium]
MAAPKPKVVVTRKLPEPVETRMRELFEARLNYGEGALEGDALRDAMGWANVLVPTLGDRIDADLLAHAGDSLKLIANFGAGVDHIDVPAAAERGITVTNTPDVLTEDTADMTMALILATPRRLVEGANALRAGQFQGWTPTWLMGRRVGGKRLGVLGMGRIGQAVARRAKAFGLQIHYHNRRPVSPAIEESLEATYWDSLDQMLARVDILSIHCPKTPATYHLMNRRRLSLLQPEAYVVNTSRGEIIDEEALIELLQAGRIAGAGLDVFEHEPAVDPRLLELNNVVVLPHLGSATIESREAMGEAVIINIRVWASGERPPNRVIPEML